MRKHAKVYILQTKSEMRCAKKIQIDFNELMSQVKKNVCSLLQASCGRGCHNSSSSYSQRLSCTSRQWCLFLHCGHQPNQSMPPSCSTCPRSSQVGGRMCRTCQRYSSHCEQKITTVITYGLRWCWYLLLVWHLYPFWIN